MKTPKYAIGQQFIPRGKVKRLHTVVDIHTTTNSKGEFVKFCYIATHEFCGQVITSEVVETTIAMALAENSLTS